VARNQKRGVPLVSRNAWRGTETEMPKAEADCLRHWRQWQT
jgi:hypothetical protein